jgi:hypothetical protein
MLGCAFSKAATFASIALTSVGALHGCQKVMVDGLLASSVAPDVLEPVQAVAVRAIAVAATARRTGAILGMTELLGACAGNFWACEGNWACGGIGWPGLLGVRG